LDDLKKQLGELAGRLQTMESTLVPPQRMTGLLEDMIGRKTGLRLLSLKTLPVAPLLDKKAGAEEKEAAKPVDKVEGSSAGLFKHGVEIRLEGSYQELTAYLERLEQAKLKLLWSSVSLSAEKHPKLVLTLTVYTLSLDRAWLIV
jgi:MSHA biogenesis protein MshJ